ncbi:MAG: hypothetical protein IH960_06985 [Chloroflexi bacterium]|nr:hypothetical protein [Chloroflexota bacterium]
MATLLAVAIACGGSDESSDTVAADPPTTPPEPTSTAAPTVPPTARPEPAAGLIIPVVEPEPGSDEAAIFDVFERVTRALRTDDLDSYLALCNPARKAMTIPQLEFIFDNLFSQYGDLTGLNHRDVTVRVFKDDTALTESIMYSFDDIFFESFSYSFNKIDGTWYANSNCTAGG